MAALKLQDWVIEHCRIENAGPASRDQYRWCVGFFEKHIGREATVDDLNRDAINDFILTMRDEGRLSMTTVHARRKMMRVLALSAMRWHKIDPWELGLLVRVKTAPSVVVGFSLAEAKKVLAWVETFRDDNRDWLSKRYKTGILRQDFWSGYLRATWMSGAPKDLRELRWDDLSEDGIVAIQRSKTSKALLWKFDERTLSAMGRIRYDSKSELVFPLWSDIRAFRREARTIFTGAGFPDRSLGGFRSGSGTDVARRYGSAAGAEHLGNTEQVFKKHYKINRLMTEGIKTPTPL